MAMLCSIHEWPYHTGDRSGAWTFPSTHTHTHARAHWKWVRARARTIKYMNLEQQVRWELYGTLYKMTGIYVEGTMTLFDCCIFFFISYKFYCCCFFRSLTEITTFYYFYFKNFGHVKVVNTLASAFQSCYTLFFMGFCVCVCVVFEISSSFILV